MSSKGYVSVAELSGDTSDIITWDVMLPNEAVPERIGIHVGRMNWLAKRAGFGSVAIHGYWGKTTEYVPQIGGMASHGLALGTRSLSVVKAELKKTNVDQPDFGDENLTLHEYFQAHGDISLNLAEIESRVNQKGRQKNPQRWAKLINSGLKDGIGQITLKNLWSERTPMERKLGLGINFAAPSLMETAVQLGSRRPHGLEGNLSVAGQFFTAVEVLNAITIVVGKSGGGERKEKRPRLSFFPFIQFDRLALVTLSTDYMKLAKAITETSH